MLNSRRTPCAAACAVLTALAACADAPTAPELPPPPAGAIEPVALTTFDGSGEAVHPDPVTTPATWGATRSYLTVTPYPNGASSYENPSVFAGNGWLQWRVPSGAQNPVAHPPEGGYLSDPDQLYDPATGEIWLYYREVTRDNRILLIRSHDGVHWSVPALVLSVPNHLAVSPTIVRRGPGDWLMWTVNAGGAGCAAPSTKVELRRSADGLTWSAPVTADVPTLDGTHGPEWPWHLDVTWIAARKEFWGVYNAKTAGGCTTQRLRLMTSADGVHWQTYPVPLLEHGAIPEFEDIVYRAAIAYDPAADAVTLWYSGAREKDAGYVWRVATQRMSRATMFAIAAGDPRVAARLAQPAAQVAAAPPNAGGHAPPPLTNETAP